MVIDELIVTLGLDTSKFSEQQRAALDAFRRSQQEFERTGKAVEHQGTKIADVFSVMRKGALGVLGAFIGGEAASFVDHVVNMDANTGRFSRTIGTAVENLGAWQALMGMMGGKAEDANGALLSLRNTMNNFAAGMGDLPAGLPFLLSKVQGDVRKMSPEQILTSIGSALRGEIAGGSLRYDQAASYLRTSVPGMSEAMIAALLNKNFNEMLESARKVAAVTQQNTDAAEKLQAVFSKTVTAAERFGSQFVTGVEKLLELLSRFLPSGVGEKIYKGFVGDGQPHSIPEKSLMGRLSKWLSGDSGGTSSERASASEREGWIRSLAQSLGIDPQVAMGVARSEGFGKYSGDQGTSFGDFQLHVTPGGRGGAVGDAFRKATGKDPSDPKNEREMDEFALRWAATHGWGDFHGAARTGIGQWQGIGASGSAAARAGSSRSSSVTSTSTTNIAKVEVHTQATDAEGIAADIAPAIKYASITAPANSGLA